MRARLRDAYLGSHLGRTPVGPLDGEKLKDLGGPANATHSRTLARALYASPDSDPIPGKQTWRLTPVGVSLHTLRCGSDQAETTVWSFCAIADLRFAAWFL
ncbi:hypothetical protein Vau01_052430 [Virgisporangium aurantiacum]|uniref:Uncharacterized protein n=1 Tax=Virgisporangium aurantiacum TaxID=175570 RepID=A0A8J3Z7B6_9ACTN|nr:hypothetical protein Vau01_052430 [Virgisporangium aurantiacum]